MRSRSSGSATCRSSASSSAMNWNLAAAAAAERDRWTRAFTSVASMSAFCAAVNGTNRSRMGIELWWVSALQATSPPPAALEAAELAALDEA